MKIKILLSLIVFLIISILISSYIIINNRIVNEDKSIENNSGWDSESSCGKIETQTLVGSWKFKSSSADIPEGEISLLPEMNFNLTGWKSQDYSAQGSWSYDESNNLVNLKMSTDTQYYKAKLLEMVQPYSGMESYNAEDPSMSMRINYGKDPNANDCHMYFNFFGWTFSIRK